MFHSEHGLCFRTSSSVSLCMVCTPAFISISCDGYVALVARYVSFFSCHQVCMTACWTRAGCRKKKEKNIMSRCSVAYYKVARALTASPHYTCMLHWSAKKEKKTRALFFCRTHQKNFVFVRTLLAPIGNIYSAAFFCLNDGVLACPCNISRRRWIYERARPEALLFLSRTMVFGRSSCGMARSYS